MVNLRSLISAAQDAGIGVFVSPHYYYPQDHAWKFGGALETMMHAIGMFDRKGALDTDGFSGSGADWEETLKPLIEKEGTVVASPHKVYGPQSNDLALQLRKQGIDKMILAGCQQTSVLRHICVTCWKMALRFASLKTQRLRQSCLVATLTLGRFSTSE